MPFQTAVVVRLMHDIPADLMNAEHLYNILVTVINHVCDERSFKSILSQEIFDGQLLLEAANFRCMRLLPFL